VNLSVKNFKTDINKVKWVRTDYAYPLMCESEKTIESLEADNALLTAKVEELQSLCMEFASLGRVSINQNDALKVLCESYSEIANQRHLTTNRGES